MCRTEGDKRDKRNGRVNNKISMPLSISSLSACSPLTAVQTCDVKPLRRTAGDKSQLQGIGRWGNNKKPKTSHTGFKSMFRSLTLFYFTSLSHFTSLSIFFFTFFFFYYFFISLLTPDKDYVLKALVFLIVLYVLSYRRVHFSRAVLSSHINLTSSNRPVTWNKFLNSPSPLFFLLCTLFIQNFLLCICQNKPYTMDHSMKRTLRWSGEEIGVLILVEGFCSKHTNNKNQLSAGASVCSNRLCEDRTIQQGSHCSPPDVCEARHLDP